MFDFLRWREWLRGKAQDLRRDGIGADWKVNEKHLASTSIEFLANDRAGSFRSYSNGYVDYEVLHVISKKFLNNETMIVVSDDNFSSVFKEFCRAMNVVDGSDVR